MTRTTALLVALFAFSSATAVARAAAPRVVARADGAEVAGLPAISADGSTLAYVEPFEASSDADRLVVVFVRVSDNVQTERWLVLERDEAGTLLPAPVDDHGATPWRRARNLTLELRGAGYRSLASVGELTFDATGPLRGAGLRITQRRRDVTVHALRDGHARWTGSLPAMPAFCGMSDERPRNVPPSLRAAWVDAASSVALLEYGHVYASCMCPSDLAFLPVVLTP